MPPTPESSRKTARAAAQTLHSPRVLEWRRTVLGMAGFPPHLVSGNLEAPPLTHLELTQRARAAGSCVELRNTTRFVGAEVSVDGGQGRPGHLLVVHQRVLLLARRSGDTLHLGRRCALCSRTRLALLCVISSCIVLVPASQPLADGLIDIDQTLRLETSKLPLES